MDNPWISIWTTPRATMRQILDAVPTTGAVVGLAILGNFATALTRASMDHLGDRFSIPVILLYCAGLAVLGGTGGLYLAGILVRWTGKWLGGQAASGQVRAALAWSGVPLIWSLILWVPAVALLPQGLFTDHPPTGGTVPSLALLGFGLTQIVVGVWAWVVLLKCLAEAQRFSAWKALGNLLLAGIIVSIPVLLAAIALSALR